MSKRIVLDLTKCEGCEECTVDCGYFYGNAAGPDSRNSDTQGKGDVCDRLPPLPTRQLCEVLSLRCTRKAA